MRYIILERQTSYLTEFNFKKIYINVFYNCVEERTVLSPVAGQVDPDGNDIDNSMNVQGDTTNKITTSVGRPCFKVNCPRKVPPN
jgi:hypothetical protein